MRQTTVTLVAMLAVIGWASLSAADHPTERDATFIGSTTVEHDLNEECANAIGEDECTVRIIRGLISVVCDDGDGHPYTAGLYDGIGGVTFCEVPMETIVTIQYQEVVGPVEPNGFVTCPHTDPNDPDATTWHTEFGRLSGSAPVDMEVPNWCDEVGDDEHPGVTNVGVFNFALSVNNEAVGVIVEGGVTLAY